MYHILTSIQCHGTVQMVRYSRVTPMLQMMRKICLYIWANIPQYCDPSLPHYLLFCLSYFLHAHINITCRYSESKQICSDSQPRKKRAIYTALSALLHAPPKGYTLLISYSSMLIYPFSRKSFLCISL